MITPEVSSADSGNSAFWVGIEITGVLNKADDQGSPNQEVRRYPSQSMNIPLPGISYLKYRNFPYS
jgi:hypothetical protein